MSRTENEKIIDSSPEYPVKTTIQSTSWNRIQSVREKTLIRAQGKCENCLKDAPFKRNYDNTPYLEVHHIQPLSNGGKDKEENAIALCPNCHREAHYGSRSEILKQKWLIKT